MSKKTVAVAMSGGVDSSVAAYLLKKQGYDVVGLFMHFWADPEFKKAENKCCSLEAREDARRVAKQLGFPLYTLNFDKDFKKTIVDDFIKQYESGLTPNPCIRCNQFIKFDLLLKKAKAFKADYLATGHYLNIKQGRVFKAKDRTKDQSYFLYNLNQNILKHLLFPLGGYNKKQIIAIAKKQNLLPSKRKESQDVCFVASGELDEFLKKYISKKKLKKGDIVDVNTKQVLGRHEGLFHYTTGQRGGIGSGGSGPYYVTSSDHKKNVLFVTNNAKDPALHAKQLQAKKINWIAGQTPKFPLKCKAKSRYGQKDQEVIIKRVGTSLGLSVQFEKKQRALTPGQSIVFYKRNELLGGAVISKIL